tara:strand:- start:2433 stop:2732 length:300 start_codon:yes stop_codon:yes gene_type:complete
MKIEEVFPYLCVTNAAAAIDFYQRAFDVTETCRLTEPARHIGHAELAFGPMTLMLSDEFPEYGERSGVVRDPFSHRWLIRHHIEDVRNDEMLRWGTGLR